jgi:ABC-type Fe3+/spermidine/putrescine transport system ATPase subunit
MALLNVHGLSKSLAGKPLFRAVSFELPEDTILGLTGNDANALDSVLRTLAGLESADEGSVLLNKRNVSGLKMLEHRIVYCFPEETLLAQQSVWENVISGAGPQDAGTAELEGRARDILNKTDLADLAARPIAELNAEQKFFTALSRSLVLQPKTLLIVSPCNDLDPAGKRRLLEKLRALLKESGISAIFASANYQDIFAICDSAALFQGSEMIQTGTPRELYEHPVNAFAASFLGENNLIPALRVSFNNQPTPVFKTMAGGHVLQTGQTDKRSLGAFTSQILLAVRPEHISISFGASFPEDNLIKAVITGVRYLGATTRVTLDADGLALEALVLRLVGLNVGDECMVGLPPDRILVLKD